jgi:hypothetical protein
MWFTITKPNWRTWNPAIVAAEVDAPPIGTKPDLTTSPASGALSRDAKALGRRTLPKGLALALCFLLLGLAVWVLPRKQFFSATLEKSDPHQPAHNLTTISPILTHRIALHLDAMGVVHQPVEDAV